MQRIFRYVAVLLAVVVFTQLFTTSAVSAASETSASSRFISDAQTSLSTTGYYTYQSLYAGTTAPYASIQVSGGDAYDMAPAENFTFETAFEGTENCLRWTGQSGSASWRVNVGETGLYAIGVNYWMLDTSGRTMEFSLAVDGAVPFDEAERLLLRQQWQDTGLPERDKRGNDLRPAQEIVQTWLTANFEDTEGFFDGAYLFYFTAGEHTLTLTCNRGEAVIGSIIVANEPSAPAYAQYAQANAHLPVASDVYQVIEAEQPLYKSDSTLIPIYDRSSANTTPYDKAKIRLNTIGGENWRYPGQYITWEIDAPADGLYRLSFRLRQNIQLGMKTRRALYIDGTIPFAEAAELSFPYQDAWVNYTPGDEEGDYLFALSAGRHTITLKVVMGSAARTMQVIQQNVYRLNDDYRKMLAITGPTPDRLHEYRLDVQIPSLLDDFIEVAEALEAEEAIIVAAGGDKGGETAILGRLSKLLRMCVKDPDTIPDRMEDLKGTISALATYMLVLKEQTLEIDKIYLSSPEYKLPRAADTWWQAITHQLNMFVSSFREDFSVVDLVDESENRVITVWIYGGRDQAQIVKTMANDTFTRETGIDINLMLVQTDLMSAIVSGNAPDVMLNAGRGMPVNLAMRNAAVDLSALEGFDEVTARFMPDATRPYQYKNGVYALPVTQMFHMMFYRTDIFAELGIEPPNTWEDFYEIIPVLQRRNMEIGLPYEQMRGANLQDAVNVAEAGMGTRNIFTTLLMQNGQELFTPDASRTTLDQEPSVEAFKMWCDLYTMYSLPLYYDFYNRFRIGIMPIGIQGYWLYNQLMVAAPELRGLWAMTSIPGTRRADGTIDRSEGASGEGAVLIKGTKDLDAAWAFMQWWTDAPTQMRFGQELEILMGPSARYNTANIEAFGLLPWSAEEQRIIMEQWEAVREVPVIAGGYYTARNIDNAFRRVVFYYENPRDMLARFNKDINDEITRKQIEFGQ